MEIIPNHHQGIYSVTLSGKFTFSDHPAFREILKKITESDVRQVILKMAAVDFVDSAALGMLLLARDEAQKYQKELVIHGATGQVKKTFELAKFDTLFVIK